MLLAACFHIIQPSKRPKCSLRHRHFQNFPADHAPPPVLREAHAYGDRLVGLLVASRPPAKKPAALPYYYY